MNKCLVFDVNVNGGGDFGDLLEWDLIDLYFVSDSFELIGDIEWLVKECVVFVVDYEGKLVDLIVNDMLIVVQWYEQIDIIVGCIMLFVGLCYYQIMMDVDCVKFMLDCQDKIIIIIILLVFWSFEFNCIDDVVYDGWMVENVDLVCYKFVFDCMCVMKLYQLLDEFEKFLYDIFVVGVSVWNKLFDEIIVGLMFNVDGEELNIEGMFNLLLEQDCSKCEVGVCELV